MRRSKWNLIQVCLQKDWLSITANRIIFNSIYPGERQSPLSFLLIAKVVVDGNLKYQGLNLFLLYYFIRGAAKKKTFFFGRSLPNLFTHPPTPGFLWDLGERKVKFGSKKAIFGAIWGGFEGFGPCLGVSHPTHPYLGEISQKKTVFFFGSSP